jgi:hypothetical protein
MHIHMAMTAVPNSFELRIKSSIDGNRVCCQFPQRVTILAKEPGKA